MTCTREENAAEMKREEEERANWPVHKVRVTQTYKVTKTIEVDVRAPTPKEAVEEIAEGDVPDDYDPRRWEAKWDLQNEEYEVV